MRILVTGSKGFIGKNLVMELKNQGYEHIYEYDIGSTDEDLEEFTRKADFVFHLAGVNRPKSNKDFMKINFGLTDTLLSKLKKHRNNCPIMISSSIQATQDNPYGKSKKAGEDLLKSYSKKSNAKVLIYRFPNVFGKWCRPNYNSVVATFSYNIANGLPIKVNDKDTILSLIYIDDILFELIKVLEGKENKVKDYCYVQPVYQVRLGELADLLYSFKNYRKTREIPSLNNDFIKKLYSNYLSYLPSDEFSYNLEMNMDERGSFTEFIKTLDCGQISVNISKPGIVKGNHWHHSKTEKFLIVSGKGIVRFRKVDEKKIHVYYATGEKLEDIVVPPGYTHNIENLGDEDMVTIIWANEKFDPDNPDTYFLEV
ncbi:MAG: capsular polysaccharide biosynthesis protein CapF [Halanaerobiales bacterium]|nr:capsular polysaccharide biosynthesis protein CapF [Halanaerobiales bacterium]